MLTEGMSLYEENFQIDWDRAGFVDWSDSYLGFDFIFDGNCPPQQDL